MAKDLIAFNHPLAETKIQVAFPWLQYFMKNPEEKKVEEDKPEHKQGLLSDRLMGTLAIDQGGVKFEKKKKKKALNIDDAETKYDPYL
jgi:hypothetical protein